MTLLGLLSIRVYALYGRTSPVKYLVAAAIASTAIATIGLTIDQMLILSSKCPERSPRLLLTGLSSIRANDRHPGSESVRARTRFPQDVLPCVVTRSASITSLVTRVLRLIWHSSDCRRRRAFLTGHGQAPQG